MVVEAPPSSIPVIAGSLLLTIIIVFLLIALIRKQKHHIRLKIINAVISILSIWTISLYLYYIDLEDYYAADSPTKAFSIIVSNNSGKPLNMTLSVNSTNGTNIYFENLTLDSDQKYITPVFTYVKGQYLIYIRLEDGRYAERYMSNSYSAGQPKIEINSRNIYITQWEL